MNASPEFICLNSLCKAAVGGVEPAFESLPEFTPELLEQARRHKVDHLLYHYRSHFSTRDQQVIAQAYQQTMRRSLLLNGSLLKLARALESSGLRYVTMKGPALANRLYEDSTRRDSVDLDIMAHVSDWEPLHQCLVNIGYEQFIPRFPLSNRLMKHHLYLTDQISYRQKKTGQLLEVHFAPFKNRRLFGISVEEMLSARIVGELEGAEVPVLSDVHRLLYLATHASKHYWRRLNWLLDVGLFIGQITARDWEQAMGLAKLLKLERPLLQGIRLMQELWAYQLPDGYNEPTYDSKVDTLTQKGLLRLVASQYHQKDLASKWREVIYRAEMKPDLLSAMVEIREQVFHLRLEHLPSASQSAY